MFTAALTKASCLKSEVHQTGRGRDWVVLVGGKLYGDISAAKKLFSTHSMPRNAPDSPVVRPRFSERARLRLARRNHALEQFLEG
jgi:hypothetical protein